MTILETFLIERGVIGSLLIMPNQIDLAIENSLLPKHFNARTKTQRKRRKRVDALPAHTV